MWVIGIVSGIFLSFDLYKFLPKYLVFRFRNKKCFALIEDLTTAKWVLGSFPLASPRITARARFYRVRLRFYSGPPLVRDCISDCT